MSPLITPDIVSAAIDALRPQIKSILDTHGRTNLHGVVIFESAAGSHSYAFDGSLAGSRNEYPQGKPYHEVALAKAQLALRVKMNTGDVLHKAPQLIKKGDPLFQGGIYLPGFAVGVSGAPAHVDEEIATLIGEVIVAHCRTIVSKLQATALEGGPWRLTGASLLPDDAP